MTDRNNVLARRTRPTTKSYRAAVKQIVLDLQARHGLSGPELADRIGCSPGTVKNAVGERTNLDGVTLANLEYEFGPGAIDPFAALGGSRAIALCPSSHGDINPALEISEALTKIIAAQHIQDPTPAETLANRMAAILPDLVEARIALDILIRLANEERSRAAA